MSDMVRAESLLQAHPRRVGWVVGAVIWGFSLALAGIVAFVDTPWYLANVSQLISTLIKTLGTVLAIVLSITIFGVDTGDQGYPTEIENIHFYSRTYYITVSLFFTAILVDVVVQLLGEQTLLGEWRAPMVVFGISFSVLSLFWVPLYSLYIARWRSPSDKLEIWYTMQPEVEARGSEDILGIVETLAHSAVAGILSDDKSTAREASDRLWETLEGIREHATVSRELYEETAGYIREIAVAAREAKVRELYRRVSSLFIALFAWAIEAADRAALQHLLDEYTRLIYDGDQMDFSTYQLPIYRHLRSTIKEVDHDQVDESGILQVQHLLAAGENVMMYFRTVTTPYEQSRGVEEFLDLCYEVHRLLVFSQNPPESSMWSLSWPNTPLERVLNKLLEALVNGVYELIAVHSDKDDEARLMPAETSLGILNSILTESRRNWDDVHEFRMSVFYLEAVHLLEQTGVIELESCVSQVGMHEHEFKSMCFVIERLRQPEREREFFTGDYRVEQDEIMSFDNWLNTFEERIKLKIDQMQ